MTACAREHRPWLSRMLPLPHPKDAGNRVQDAMGHPWVLWSANEVAGAELARASMRCAHGDAAQ